MAKKLIAEGAEAKIYLNESKGKKNITKDRIKKSYRIPEIDLPLRKGRTRREAKILRKLVSLGFDCPANIDDQETSLNMGYLDGKKVRDVLKKDNMAAIIKEVAEKIAFMHNNGIIHGDLTTSNMIICKENKKGKDKDKKDKHENKIYLIDFGLSYFSDKVEDKAVDLHLFKQALESKHYLIWEKAFKMFLTHYSKHAKHSDDILKRFEIVETRGRYKERPKTQ